MCLGTELDLEVVVTFQTKWSSLTHPWAKHSLEGVGRPVMAEEAAPALKPGIPRDSDRPTHKCGPLSRQHFTHFALTSFHLYVAPTEESSRWRRGAASNRWNGAAEADAPLFSPSVTSSSSVPSSQAAEQTPRPAVPFCPLSPDGVLRRHWRFPLLPVLSSLLCVAPGRGQSGAGRGTPTAAATTTPSSGEPVGIYAIDPVAPSLAPSRQAGWPWLPRRLARAWPTPPPSPRLWRRRCRRWRSGPNRSAARQGRERERDPSHISLPVDSGIANLYL